MSRKASTCKSVASKAARMQKEELSRHDAFLYDANWDTKETSVALGTEGANDQGLIP